MTKTQNLLQFSLKCHPIHSGIHKDPYIGAQTWGCLRYSNGYPVLAGIVGCEHAIVYARNPDLVKGHQLRSWSKLYCRL